MPDLTASGVFEATGDTDWFRVHLEAGTSYELNAGNQNLFLSLRLPDGSPLVLPYPYGSYAAFVAPVTGDYFISAHSQGQPMPYTLTIRDFVDMIPASSATPFTLELGQTRHVPDGGTSTNISNDQDWFGIDLVAGQTYVLSVPFGHAFVVDSAGHLLTNDQSGTVHFTATTTGRFYAGVSASSAYDVTFATIADDHPDNLPSAGTLAIGASVTGTWESYGDTDWYAVQLDAGGSYRFSLAGTDGSSLPSSTVQVADANGTVLLTAPSGNYAIFSATTAGTYYVRAGNPVSGFTPALTNYSLTAAAVTDLANNTTTTALLTIGGTVNSSLIGLSDRDWIAVDLMAGQTYDFTLTAGYRLDFSLRDATGAVVTDYWYGNSASVDGLSVHHTAETTGRYYLQVDLDGIFNPGLGSYQVRAVVSPADDLPDNATTTGRLEVGGTATGVSESRQDVDWFAIDLIAGHSYQFDPQSGAIGFYDAERNALTPGGGYSDYAFTPSTSGTYYLAVGGGYSGGAYEVSVTEFSDDYSENASTTGYFRQSFGGTADADNLVGTAFHDFMSAGAGNDTIFAGAGSDLLFGGDGDDALNGGDGIDTLFGQNGNDILTGGLGADLLIGSTGTDTASYEDNQGSVFVNLTTALGYGGSAEGDRYSSIENVRGTSYDDFIIGNNNANRLEGMGGNDTLIGSLGADVFDGGSGIDTVSYIDNQGPIFINLTSGLGYNNAAEGDSFIGVENITGGIYNDFIIGNSVGNRIDGGAGDDYIIGALGPDAIIGGDGNDTASYEDNQGPIFINLTTGMGYGNAAEGDTFSGIENVIGELYDDFIIGDVQANRIEGRYGNDTLIGAGGADTFVFNTTLSASGNVDIVTDFTHGTDRIELSHSVFAALGLGTLDAGAFSNGPATTANQHIIYDAATGTLSYDADGSGAGAAIAFATLQNHAAITSADFLIV